MRKAVLMATLGGAAVALSGCLPLPLTIASFALDGASWVASGKTMSEHGLSMVTGEDCKFLRVVEDGTVCAEVPHYESQVAILEPKEALAGDTGGVLLPGVDPLQGLEFHADHGLGGGASGKAAPVRPWSPGTDALADLDPLADGLLPNG